MADETNKQVIKAGGATPPAGPPESDTPTSATSESDVLAALQARLEALEAKQAAQDKVVEEANPTYAQTKDSADKSRYPEVDEEGYKAVGLAGANGNYADTAKVDDMYHAQDDSDSNKHVVSYRVRALGGETVISAVLDRASEKVVIYLNKD